MVLAVCASKTASPGHCGSVLFAVLHCTVTMAALAAKYRRDATSVHARGLRMRGGHGRGVLAGCRSSQARAGGHGAGRIVRRSVARSRSRPRRHVARGTQTGIYTRGVCCGAPRCAVRGVDRHPGGVPCVVSAPITLVAACVKDLKHGSEAHHDPMRVDRVFGASCSLLRVRARPAASRVCH